MAEEVIKISGLRKYFGNNHVLENINLSLKKGDNIVVLGRSGTGKSVLIKCIVGLICPDMGELKVLGKDISLLRQYELDEVRKKTGFLFQGSALYDSMTVRENLEFPLRHIKGLSHNKKTEMVHEALENVGLSEAIDKMPSELSGGMRKRIGLARTIILKPQIILYDEPTTGLDPITSKEISSLILDLQKKYNISSIIITHDIPCARITGDKLVILRHGKIEAEGNFDEMENHKDPWVRSFFE
jgi:phospholipid/cholesterol/gamma-HCH transport system ATP-binding protein